MAYTTINKSSEHFNTKLYTGNGSYGHGITGVGFQPDLVWIKNRVDNADHRIFDAVRGTDKSLSSNTTNATVTGVNLLHSFDSDGFTVDDDGAINTNNNAICSWNWKANGAGSANTAGTINSTVSVNTTAGFSIVSFVGNATSGATVGHGLNAVPKVVIIKGRDSALEWRSYFSPIGAGKYMVLNENHAEATGSNFMNNTAPTSSVFSLGNGATPNKNGENYIAYCFAEKQGYSKFGSYIGNGNADGTFIYTGFKPAWIMFKRTDNTGNWYIKDNKRSGTSAGQNFGQMNPNQTQYPSADTSSVENKTSGYAMDILSNGFKTRGTDSGINASGGTYIYMAFAEAPLVGTNGVTAKAR